MRKIIPRLLLGFLLLSPLPLAGLAWLYTHEFERALNETVLANLSSIADKKADQINAYLDERKLDGQLLARSDAVFQMLRPGKQAAAARRQAETSGPRNPFRTLFELGGYYDLLLTDAAGEVVFSILHEPDFGSNLNSGPYRDSILAQGHREALASQAIHISPARNYVPSAGRSAIFIVIPVVEAGKSLGTLALQLDLDKLTAVTSDVTGLGQSGETVLAQNEGDEVYYVAPLRHIPEAAFHYRVAMDRAATPMRAALNGAHGRGVTRDYFGVEISAAWRHLPALNWGMVVKMDSAETMAPVRDLRHLTIAALGILGLVAILVAVFLGRSLVLPIRRLMAATGRIAEGDLTQRAPTAGVEEFRQLATSFNLMADRLATDQATLEARVADRSQALRESMARYDALVAQIPAGVFTSCLNAEGELSFEYVSPRFCQLVGQDEKTLLAEPLRAFALLYEGDVDEWVRFMREMAPAPVPFRHEYRYLINGNLRWYRTEVDPILLDDGGSRWNGTLTDITARKQAELALEASEARFRSIFEHANTGMVIINPQRRLVKVNNAFAKLLGYEVAELEGMGLDDITYPDDIVDGRALYLARQASNDKDFRMEKRYLTKSGALVWVDHSVAAICDEKGDPVTFIGIVVDISERKKAEAALQETLTRAKRFADALDSVSSYIHIKDRQHRYVYANRAVLEFFGLSAEALMGRDDSSLFPPKVAAHFRATEERVLNQGETVQDLIPDSLDANARMYLTVKQPTYDEKGEISGLCGVSTDITDRIRAEEAMRLAHDEQVAIFESATHGIAFVKERLIVKCNHRLEELFGYGQGELLGQPTRIWYFDDGTFKAGGKIYPVLEHGGVQRRTAAVRRKDGSSFWCRFSGRALVPSDIAAGTVWIIEDITQEHEAAQAMVRAREAAEAANRSKSEFLANMSHEIRTPMNAMLGLTQLVLESGLPSPQADYLRKANKAGKALLGILNDILDYSKIEAGRLDIERVPLNVETLLKEVGDLFIANIEEKGLELFLEIDPALPARVLGDPLRLMQVLNNLVGNAVKFTDRGEIHILAELDALDDDAARLRFTVRDTGIGLSRQQSSRLFDAFTQADGTITRKYGGTGLGLAICQKLTRLMGGDIAVSSEPDHGASFCFTVAVGALAADAEPLAEPRHLNLGRVLVVDEEPTSRRILDKILARWQLETTTVVSGEEALAAFDHAASEGNPYGVVLFDWRLSGMGGRALAIRLDEERRRRGALVPRLVAMVAARDRDASATVAGAARPDALLPKPVTPTSLYAALQDAGHGGAATAAAGRPAPAGMDFDGARILLVEDNVLNQQVAIELLKRRGIAVTVAKDGSEALQRIGATRFDMVLMDLHMPEMDGFEATRRIRELAAGRELPVIAMTAAVMEEDRVRCAMAGMDGFIAKPVDADALARELGRWLSPVATTGRSVAASHVDAHLPSIPGFDLTAALRRLNGDRNFLERLLLGFAQSQAGAAAEIAALLESGQKRAARDRLHGLKGAAANLGINAVAATAQALEQELLGDGPLLSRQAFDRALTEALAAIAGLVHRPAIAGGEWEPARVAALLSKLRHYLEQRELVPDELLVALQRLAASDWSGEPLSDLLRRIDAFDHDGALAIIARVAATQALELDP